MLTSRLMQRAVITTYKLDIFSVFGTGDFLPVKMKKKKLTTYIKPYLSKISLLWLKFKGHLLYILYNLGYKFCHRIPRTCLLDSLHYIVLLIDHNLTDNTYIVGYICLHRTPFYIPKYRNQ